MKDLTRRYSNGDITVVWKPAKCMHSGICFAGLGKVFDPRRRPWIVLENATSAEILAQVKDCPSGALSMQEPKTDPGSAPDDSDGSGETETPTDENEIPTLIEVSVDGPLLVTGQFEITKTNGEKVVMDKCALCRCGASANKPFCDGSHSKNGFKG